MTPEEFAETANNDPLGVHDDKMKQFLRDASAMDIQRFIHRLNTIGNPPLFQFAKVALEIKLAENADLIADKLMKQTDSLLRFTIGIYVFTSILVVFALIQILVAIMDYCSKNH